MAVFWITLVADSVVLACTIYAATKKPLLIDFLSVGLAMCSLAAALHQFITGHMHITILVFSIGLSLLLMYRLNILWANRRRKI